MVDLYINNAYWIIPVMSASGAMGGYLVACRWYDIHEGRE